ncbi:MAG: hypothetical protein CME36_09300 [unclassified Hahellaceae]|nr:hypothetical protein [Hahellaceae bacterium]
MSALERQVVRYSTSSFDDILLKYLIYPLFKNLLLAGCNCHCMFFEHSTDGRLRRFAKLEKIF